MHQEIHLPNKYGEIIDLYGLSLIDGVYHIFFLYKTDSENKRWGHFATKDFLEYKFSSGKADIIGYKPGNTHFFANTCGETLMLELIKPPDKARKSFLSLPKTVVIAEDEPLKYPPKQLHELREYKRALRLHENESADTFGVVFEAVLTFGDDTYSLKLRDDVLIECDNGCFTVEYDTLKQSFETEDFKSIHVFSDTESVEIFAGGKALSLPTAHNEKGTVTVLRGQCRAEIYKLKSIKVVHGM